jgi:hypothetical protein
VQVEPNLKSGAMRDYGFNGIESKQQTEHEKQKKK